jgi:hypothetical protein
MVGYVTIYAYGFDKIGAFNRIILAYRTTLVYG